MQEEASIPRRRPWMLRGEAAATAAEAATRLGRDR